MLKCLSEPMNYPQSISHSKKMGDRTRIPAEVGDCFLCFAAIFHFLAKANAHAIGEKFMGSL